MHYLVKMDYHCFRQIFNCHDVISDRGECVHQKESDELCSHHDDITWTIIYETLNNT